MLPMLLADVGMGTRAILRQIAVVAVASLPIIQLAERPWLRLAGIRSGIALRSVPISVICFHFRPELVNSAAPTAHTVFAALLGQLVSCSSKAIWPKPGQSSQIYVARRIFEDESRAISALGDT